MATGLVVNKTQVYFGPNTTQYPSDNSYAGPNEYCNNFMERRQLVLY